MSTNRNNKNLTNSLVSQSNFNTNQSKSSQGKSVYESVLEERRNRKNKQSRIIWSFYIFYTASIYDDINYYNS
jgi:hypothetical protein